MSKIIIRAICYGHTDCPLIQKCLAESLKPGYHNHEFNSDWFVQNKQCLFFSTKIFKLNIDNFVYLNWRSNYRPLSKPLRSLCLTRHGIYIFQFEDLFVIMDFLIKEKMSLNENQLNAIILLRNIFTLSLLTTAPLAFRNSLCLVEWDQGSKGIRQ